MDVTGGDYYRTIRSTVDFDDDVSSYTNDCRLDLLCRYVYHVIWYLPSTPSPDYV